MKIERKYKTRTLIALFNKKSNTDLKLILRSLVNSYWRIVREKHLSQISSVFARLRREYVGDDRNLHHQYHQYVT